MFSICRLCLLILLYLPSSVFAHKHREPLLAVTDLWPPFVMSTNEHTLSGIGVEILREVVDRTDDSVTIHRVPNKRALQMFDKHQADMMVIDSPLWNTPEQARMMVFTDEIMSIQEYIYFRDDDSYIDVASPVDLQNKVVDIVRGYYYPVFEDAFNQGLVKKNEVDSEASLLKKLFLERTDAIFMDSVAFKYNVSKQGYDELRFRQGKQLSSTSLAIKLRKEHADLLPRFNTAIADMKRDGTIQSIIDRYTQ